MRRPLRLSRKVYRSCLLAALSAALICIGIFAGFAYNQVCLENARNLREEAVYIAQAVELSGVAYLEKLSPEDGSRVTWIAADGQVLYDTWVPAEAMGNHGGRAEVRQALEEGSGQSSRYSDTLAERTNNYALRIADGSVVRFSVTQASNLSLLQSAALPTLAALALVAGLTLLLAARTARDMVEPINRIDLQAPLESQTYEELRPLVRRIGTQNQQIRDQMKHLTQEHEEQDRYRREFTANVSHELKTPLTSISGFAEESSGTAWYGPRMCPGLQGTSIRKPCGSSPWWGISLKLPKWMTSSCLSSGSSWISGLCVQMCWSTCSLRRTVRG